MEHFLSLDILGDIKREDRTKLTDTIRELAGIEYVEVHTKENNIRVEGADLDVVAITDKIESMGYSVLTTQ